MVLALESKLFPPSRVPTGGQNRASSESATIPDSTKNAAQAFLNGIGQTAANRRVPQQGQDFFDPQDRPRRTTERTDRIDQGPQRTQQATRQQIFTGVQRTVTTSPILAPSSTLLLAQQIAGEEQASAEPRGLQADQGYSAYVQAGAQNGNPRAAQEATLRPAEARGQTAILSPLPASFNFAI